MYLHISLTVFVWRLMELTESQPHPHTLSLFLVSMPPSVGRNMMMLKTFLTSSLCLPQTSVSLRQVALHCCNHLYNHMLILTFHVAHFWFSLKKFKKKSVWSPEGIWRNIGNDTILLWCAFVLTGKCHKNLHSQLIINIWQERKTWIRLDRRCFNLTMSETRVSV